MKLKTWIYLGGFASLAALPLAAQTEADLEREQARIEAERAKLEAEWEKLEAQQQSIEEMRQSLEEAREAAREAAEEAREAARKASEEAREAAEKAREDARRNGVFSWIWNRDDDDGEPASMGDPENYFGVTIEGVPRALRSYLDLDDGVGILFTAVHKDSPAEKAGVKKDDILIAFAGQTIFNFDQFSKLIDLQKAGEPVPFQVMRKGTIQDLTIELEQRVRHRGSWIAPLPPGAPLPPDAPVPPDAPDAPAPPAPVGFHWNGEDEDFERVTTTVVSAIEDYLPGNVSVIVDDDKNVQVDLRGLTESLQDLEQRLQHMELKGDSMDWTDFVDLYREARNRRSVVMMGQTQMSLSNNEGKVRIFIEEGQRHAIVTSTDGKVLFDGPLPEDFETELDPVSAELIKALLEARGELETDLSEDPDVEVLEIDESEKLTKL